MSIFNIFKSSEKIKGEIKYYNLTDWWLNELSDEEKNRIIKVYCPMGSNRSIIEGDLLNASNCCLNFLWCLAGWFNNKQDRKIAFKILNKAKEYLSSSTVLDIHFYYSTMIDVYYPERENDANALKTALYACKEQISLAPKAARAFKKEYSWQDLPSHRGYEQLAILYEKEGNFKNAIAISKQALTEGWAGDWQKRIERCTKKLAKSKA